MDSHHHICDEEQSEEQPYPWARKKREYRRRIVEKLSGAPLRNVVSASDIS
jgi:hypothetical protein